MINIEQFARDLVQATGLTKNEGLIALHADRVVLSFLDFFTLKMVNLMSVEQIELFKEHVEFKGVDWDIAGFLKEENITDQPQVLLKDAMQGFAETYLANAAETKNQLK